MARRREDHNVNCDRVIVVCDNLPTQPKGTCYETFEPERIRRTEFCHTPQARRLADDG